VLVNELGGHAVFKAVVPSLVHKTEAGGVVLDVTPDAAPEVYERLAALGGRVYAEEMVTGGVEMLVGVTSTPLGRVITVASGGLLTEVLDDAVFRLLPIDTADAEEMLTELRGAAVLRGARGRPPADVAALADLLVRVGSLVLDVKRIPPLPPGADLDLNPVAVLTQGVAILDAALTFGDPLPA
jgi:acyl-CoA synthetase (NDP forming)